MDAPVILGLAILIYPFWLSYRARIAGKERPVLEWGIGFGLLSLIVYSFACAVVLQIITTSYPSIDVQDLFTPVFFGVFMVMCYIVSTRYLPKPLQNSNMDK